jgi:hypothetical protein
VPLVNVKLIEAVFDDAQKNEMIQKLTDAMVEIEGENMRTTQPSARSGSNVISSAVLPILAVPLGAARRHAAGQFPAGPDRARWVTDSAFAWSPSSSLVSPKSKSLASFIVAASSVRLAAMVGYSSELRDARAARAALSAGPEASEGPKADAPKV